MRPLRHLPIFLALALLVACGGDTVQLQKGEPVPAVSLPTLTAGPLGIPPGRVVAVRFWADWCPFCESEMRAIEPVYQKYRDQGLTVLAVNVRQDKDTVAAFVSKLGISYDVLMDHEGSVARAYGVIGLPTTFFVGRDGRLVNRILGESTPELFESMVRELL